MIRQFQPEDAAACYSIIRDCLERDTSYTPALLRNILDRENPKTMMERAKLFYISVYETENGILGLAGLDMNEIRLLYVSAAYQRQGIGRILLEHLKGMMPCSLFSDIFVYSARQAVAFYQACGFIDKGPFTFDIEGEMLQTVFMTCPLA